MLNTSQLQQNASNPKHSVWVSASAGSGKTKILSDRVLRLLLEDVSPDKILCLTYTKVASIEMQNRIDSELSKWMICDDDEIKQKLFALTGNIPNQQLINKSRTLLIKILDQESGIKIQTIHSFCQSLLKVFPFEAKIAPNFELIDTNSANLILKRAQNEILKSALLDKDLQNIIKEINAKTNDETLLELVSSLLEKKDKIIFLKEKFHGIQGVIDEIFKIFSISKIKTEEDFFQDFWGNLDQKNLPQLFFELEESGKATYQKEVKKFKSFILRPTLKNVDNFIYAILTDKLEIRKNIKKFSANYEELLISAAEKIYEFLENTNSLRIATASSQLLIFVDKILDFYQNFKRTNAYLDYGDLIVKTNHLLANPEFSDWIKMKMDGSFDHILIDESQDTNIEQWKIIKALTDDFYSGLSSATHNRSIFIVGDEKQSIYSFQGSDIKIGAEVHDHFQNKIRNNLLQIDLNVSFRSSAKILQAVDLVFKDEERQKAITKISKFRPHQAFRQSEGYVEIWQPIQLSKQDSIEDFDSEDEECEHLSENLNLAKNEQVPNNESDSSGYKWQLNFVVRKPKTNQAILSEIIAKKIKNWVQDSRAINGKNRPVEFCDIMVLVKNRTNGLSEELASAFNRNNIPFRTIDEIHFSESLMIQDFLSCAKFVLLPEDDFNLACLLKSPFFNISEEELLEFCVEKNQKSCSLFEVLKRSKFQQPLQNILDFSLQSNCFDFFFRILNQTQTQKNFLSRFGYESLEIINNFIFEVRNFCEKNSSSLQKFLEFVEKIDPKIKLDSNQKNCVQITTIHSAKGLQAPIVIIADCFHNVNSTSNKEKILWANDIPIWLSESSKNNSQLKKLRDQKNQESYEEYLRQLYVAMTRAEDELYIAGFGLKEDKNCWHQIIKSSLEDHIKEVPAQELLRELESKENKKDSEISEKEILQNDEFAFCKDSKIKTSVISESVIIGDLIHKALEFIGKNYTQPKFWLKSLSEKFVLNQNLLTKNQQKEVLDLLHNFIDSKEFSEIFCGKILCEVEINVEGNIGRIDLLKESENEVLIIDYKSDESLPKKIPQHYLDQLINYQNAVEKNFPNKKVCCAILWIRFLKIDFLKD